MLSVVSEGQGVCGRGGDKGTLLPTQSGYEPKTTFKNVYLKKKKKPLHLKSTLGVYGVTAFRDQE